MRSKWWNSVPFPDDRNGGECLKTTGWRFSAWPSACNASKSGVSLKIILLVDDSKFLRKANEKALTKAGYSVISVGDGEEALRLASARVPDLILLDMLLPKLGGQDVLAALKRNPATAAIPVIVLSSLAQTNEAKLKKEGAAAYFEKSKLGLEQGCEALIGIVENILGPGIESQEHCDSPEGAKIPSLI